MTIRIHGKYTVEYKNSEYRWWNPSHWFLSREEMYENPNGGNIMVQYRRGKILITTDSEGHAAFNAVLASEQGI